MTKTNARTAMMTAAAFAAALLAGRAASAQTTYSGNADAIGNWSDATKWTPSTGKPSAIGDAAVFGNVITAARTVTFDGPFTASTAQ